MGERLAIYKMFNTSRLKSKAGKSRPVTATQQALIPFVCFTFPVKEKSHPTS
jgi:hypothetical protein